MVRDVQFQSYQVPGTLRKFHSNDNVDNDERDDGAWIYQSHSSIT